MLALSLSPLAASRALATSRVGHRQARPVPSDLDRNLALRADADRRRGMPDWDPPRALSSYIPPGTRERMGSPPFTGWGYGATIPDAWPSF